MPVQTSLLNHLVVTTTFKYAANGHDVNNYIDNNTTEYVESVETSNGKEEVSKKKKSDEPVDITKLPKEKLGGALVYAKKGDKILFT